MLSNKSNISVFLLLQSSEANIESPNFNPFSFTVFESISDIISTIGSPIPSIENNSV